MNAAGEIEGRISEVVAAAAVPAGRWAVGVSGGADSVALLLLLAARADLALHVVHLDHETRGGASSDDAAFVAELTARRGLPCTLARRSDVERGMARLAANTSSRYRLARLALFRSTVRDHALAGVILAHHADDQAETIFQRLLRGSGPAGLCGMAPRTTVGGLMIGRPLLGVRREELRSVLAARGQPWREDASNASDDYLRNRLRRILSDSPDLFHALIELGTSCRALRDGLQAHVAPRVGTVLRSGDLLALPGPLQRELARRWLVTAAGVPPGRVEPAVIDRLIAMAADRATPARQDFPGDVRVRRKGDSLNVLGGDAGAPRT